VAPLRGTLALGIASVEARADAREGGFPRSRAAAKMEIGCDVIYMGRRYVLRGLEPMGVSDRRAELEDPESGELLLVPVALLEEPTEA
jgi:hypothetical protein